MTNKETPLNKNSKKIAYADSCIKRRLGHTVNKLFLFGISDVI